MIIASEQDVTTTVLAEAVHAPDARFREVLAVAVKHLHAFVREARLSEAEFQQLCGAIARAGQLTTASHNEVVLAAGSLGVSALVCLLNNGQAGQTETTANLMGPFWRLDAPRLPDGASIVRAPMPGLPLFVTAWVVDVDVQPVAGADVDVWQASTEGFYENQDPAQPDMNLRGTFTTEATGRVTFRSIKPAGYPVPVTGPVGDLLRAQGRHNLRPAHVHFMIRKPGFKTQFSQVYVDDDPNLDSDVQFGVTRALVGRFVRHEAGAPGCRRARALGDAGASLRHRAGAVAPAAAADHRQGRRRTTADDGTAAARGTRGLTTQGLSRMGGRKRRPPLHHCRSARAATRCGRTHHTETCSCATDSKGSRRSSSRCSASRSARRPRRPIRTGRSR